jgi:hypothetical protein
MAGDASSSPSRRVGEAATEQPYTNRPGSLRSLMWTDGHAAPSRGESRTAWPAGAGHAGNAANGSEVSRSMAPSHA